MSRTLTDWVTADTNLCFHYWW